MVESLRRLKTPFSVWHDKRLKLENSKEPFIYHPFVNTKAEIERVLQKTHDWGPYTHILASVERSVYTASIARRILDCRLSKHTLVQRCHDKLMMKKYLSAKNIPMTPFLHVTDNVSSNEIVKKLGSPVVMKNRIGSGGRSVEVHQNIAQAIGKMNRNKLLEAYVDADEVSIESFLDNGKILFSNITRYVEKGKINLVPASLDANLEKEIIKFNQTVIEALDINWGMTHLELYLSKKGLLFGEVALRPPGGYIMNLISDAYGFNAWDAFVAVELGQPFNFPTEAKHLATAMVLAPDQGQLKTITGLDQLYQRKSIFDMKIKVKPGDYIKCRESVGKDSGHILIRAKTVTKLMAEIDYVNKTLNFEVTKPA